MNMKTMENKMVIKSHKKQNSGKMDHPETT